MYTPELKDDLAYNLQLCDQLTYDNAFGKNTQITVEPINTRGFTTNTNLETSSFRWIVYFQPGNGKVNIKEPKELAKKAMKQIQQAIDLAKEG